MIAKPPNKADQAAQARELIDCLWHRAPDTIPLLWDSKYRDESGRLRRRPYQLWDAQRAVFESVVKNPMTTVRSGHGVGKTDIGAMVCILFLISHPGSYVVTTGSSYRVLEKILWPRINTRVTTCKVPLAPNMPIGGKWLPYPANKEWLMLAASTNDENNIAGFHSPAGVLVYMEEADGVPQKIYEAVQGNATSQNDRILVVGNPHTPNGAFHKTFKSSEWNKIRISCFDHPNIIQQSEVIPGAVSQTWIDRQKNELGEGSPAYASRVLGEFPEEDQFVIVPLGWIEAAKARTLPTAKDLDLAAILAVDVARSEEGDNTVLLGRNSQTILALEKHRGLPTTATSGLIIQRCREADERGLPYRTLVIDDTGVGGGVTDNVMEKRDELRSYGVETIIPFIAGGRASDPSRFINARAEAYWKARQALDPATSQFAISAGDYLPWAKSRENHFDALLEIVNIRQKPNSGGKIQIMSKDEMKARGFIKRSPDVADAFSMTFAPFVVAEPRGGTGGLGWAMRG